MPFALSFSVHGYRFHAGLDVLIKSYNDANDAVLSRTEEAKKALAKYLDDVERGMPREGDWEDGQRLWDREELLIMDIETAEEAVYELRRAYLIGLYHHWERALRLVTGDHKGRHPDLVKGAAAKNIAISPDLGKLVSVANALKHNSDSKGNAALASWPDFFSSAFTPRPNADWYSAIRPADLHIELAINIVSASGPEVQPKRP